MDIIIFAFLFICLFVAARKIATSTSGYQAKDKELTELKISSGLYDYDSNNVLRDKISILDNASEENAESRKNKAAKSIDTFMLFSKEKLSERGYEVIEKDYRDFRLSSDRTILHGVNTYDGGKRWKQIKVIKIPNTVKSISINAFKDLKEIPYEKPNTNDFTNKYETRRLILTNNIDKLPNYIFQNVYVF